MKRQKFIAYGLALVLSVFCFWLPTAAENQSHDKELEVEHAEILAPVGNSPMAAGYLVIWNGSSEAHEITGIRLSSGTTMAFHKTVVQDGIARMRPVELPYVIPSRSELIMRRGGYHLMFSTKKFDVNQEEELVVVVEFADGSVINAVASVQPFGTPRGG